MPPPQEIPPQKLLYKWLKNFLSDSGVQFSEVGSKFGTELGGHKISLTTGFWEDVKYSGTKALRWLFEIDVTGGATIARVPAGLREIGIGAPNAARGKTAGFAVRILLLVKTADSTSRDSMNLRSTRCSCFVAH
jgi:hypothetical protein